MSDSFLRRSDLDFMLYDWLGIEDLFERDRFSDHTRDGLTAIFDMCSQIAENSFAPSYKEADRCEPWLTDDGVHVIDGIRDAVTAYAEAGLVAATFDADVGGAQMPYVSYLAVMAHFLSANASAMAFPLLSNANASLLLAFGSPAQIEAFAQPEIEGRFTGTMCISETQAGSSVGDITTRALPDGQSKLGARYRLHGSKMWISGADQNFSENIVHLVLAKIPDEEGRIGRSTRDLSLFVVPKYVETAQGRERNDIFVTGLNHKMGYRGIPNCVLTIGDGISRPGGKAGAIGYLVAREGQGIATMFHMMNEARIGIGLGAAMLGYRGYLLSLAYARERVQGRLDDDSNGPVPIIRHPDVRRMLLTQKAYCEGSLALILYCGRLVDDAATASGSRERAEAQALLDLLTPVAKTWPSEWALIANNLAIQVHGGYGYTRDFDVEQLYRDNRLNPIHEGTTGIQAKDLVGRKILKDGGAAFQLLCDRVAATVRAARNNGGVLASLADLLAAEWAAMAALVESFHDPAMRASAEANATLFLDATGHAVIAWLWLDMSCSAARAEPGVGEGCIWACQHYYTQDLGRVRSAIDTISRKADAHVRIPDEFF